jgi:hypothetical protein
LTFVTDALGYMGKASGQLQDNVVTGVFLIGGESQVWVPGLVASDIRLEYRCCRT